MQFLQVLVTGMLTLVALTLYVGSTVYFAFILPSFDLKKTSLQFGERDVSISHVGFESKMILAISFIRKRSFRYVVA